MKHAKLKEVIENSEPRASLYAILKYVGSLNKRLKAIEGLIKDDSEQDDDGQQDAERAPEQPKTEQEQPEIQNPAEG